MITVTTSNLDYHSLMNKTKHDLALLVLWLIERIESGPTLFGADAEHNIELGEQETPRRSN